MKKALALLLSLVMVFQMLPVSAFAAGEELTPTDGGVSGTTSYNVSWTISGDSDSRVVQAGVLLSTVLPMENRMAITS